MDQPITKHRAERGHQEAAITLYEGQVAIAAHEKQRDMVVCGVKGPGQDRVTLLPALFATSSALIFWEF